MEALPQQLLVSDVLQSHFSLCNVCICTSVLAVGYPLLL